MKAQYTVALSMLAGIGIGAVAVQGLHAQAKPPVYYVAEVDVTDIEAYTKEYAPRAQALIKSSGGRILAAGQKVTALQGDPPKPRVAIIQWGEHRKDSRLARYAGIQGTADDRRQVREIRNFAVEGLPQ